MDDAVTAPSIVFYGGSAAGQCRNEPCNQYGSALTRPVTILHAKPWDTKERLGYSTRRREASAAPLGGLPGGFHVISPVNEALRSVTSPFRGGRGTSHHCPAALSPYLTNSFVKRCFYSTFMEYGNVCQCVQVCPPPMVQLAEMQFYVFEVLDFPNTSCIISSNENVLGFWKCSTLTKPAYS